MGTDPARPGHGTGGSERSAVGDLLAGAVWSCRPTPPGLLTSPGDADVDGVAWLPAVVPGTAASALAALGAADPSNDRLDGQDWWFRCRFAGPGPTADHGGGWVLELDGLATLADVWLNGRHLLRSESMFTSWRVDVDQVEADNDLTLRFAALTPVLGARRPRPRWRSTGVVSQNLRWIRTTLLGRQAGWARVPAPVGPWRPVRLRPVAPVDVVSRRVRSTCGEGDGPTTGTVTVDLVVTGRDLPADGRPPTASVVVGDRSADLGVAVDGDAWRLTGSVDVPGATRWWPHTHGIPHRYPVSVRIDGVAVDLAPVGFRTVTVDRTGDGFALAVNGTPVFCRGACWYPIDPEGLQATDEELAATLDLVTRAGANMLRIPGGTVYEDERFFEACDRLGILVWQDVMLGPLDPPDDDAFVEVVAAEVADLLGRTAAHPSLAVLCGGQQLEEQPAMFGLPRDRWRSRVVDEAIPGVVARMAPDLAYVTSSPSGGDLPFHTRAGVSHYFGVGVYLAPFSDLRRSAPRFVSEGLAFAVPPERVTVEEEFGGDLTARRETDWNRAVHRDAGSWFDLEDVRDHYAEELFDEGIADLWRTDHERALDLGRAAVAEVLTAALAEWRRPGSPCAGLLTIALRDQRAGPGWGMVDSSGRPKSSWFAFARSAAPLAVLATDEGANGLDVHVVNDTDAPVVATLVLGLHTAVHQAESAACPIEVPARGGVTVRTDALFDGFRDVTFAYRFGPRSYDLVTADLVDASGRVLAGTTFLPGGPKRPSDPDVGLQAVLEPVDGGAWHLRVSTQRFAEYVQVDVPGYRPDDSWFHLRPGGSRTVVLQPEAGHASTPRGRVRALNSRSLAVVGS